MRRGEERARQTDWLESSSETGLLLPGKLAGKTHVWVANPSLGLDSPVPFLVRNLVIQHQVSDAERARARNPLRTVHQHLAASLFGAVNEFKHVIHVWNEIRARLVVDVERLVLELVGKVVWRCNSGTVDHVRYPHTTKKFPILRHLDTRDIQEIVHLCALAFVPRVDC